MAALTSKQQSIGRLSIFLGGCIIFFTIIAKNLYRLLTSALLDVALVDTERYRSLKRHYIFCRPLFPTRISTRTLIPTLEITNKFSLVMKQERGYWAVTLINISMTMHVLSE